MLFLLFLLSTLPFSILFSTPLAILSFIKQPRLILRELSIFQYLDVLDLRRYHTTWYHL